MINFQLLSSALSFMLLVLVKCQESSNIHSHHSSFCVSPWTRPLAADGFIPLCSDPDGGQTAARSVAFQPSLNMKPAFVSHV